MKSHFLFRKSSTPAQCIFVVLVCLFNEASFRAEAQTPTPTPQTYNSPSPALPQGIPISDFAGSGYTTFDSIPAAGSASVTVDVNLYDLSASPENLLITLFPGCINLIDPPRPPEDVLLPLLIWDRELLVDDAGQPVRHIIATAVLPPGVLNIPDLCNFLDTFTYTVQVLHEGYGTDGTVVGMFNSCSLTINPINSGHLAPPMVDLFGGTQNEPVKDIYFGQPLTFVATASGNPSSYSIDRLGIVVTDIQSCQDLTCNQQPPPPPECQTYKSSEIFQPSSADPSPVLTYLPPTLLPGDYEVVARAIDSAGYSQTITKQLTVKRLFGLFGVLNLSCSVDAPPPHDSTTFSATLHLQNDTAVDSSELRVRLLEVASASVIFADGPLELPSPSTLGGTIPVSALPAGGMKDVAISGTVQAPAAIVVIGTDFINFHVYAVLDEFVDGQWITVDTRKVIDGVQGVAQGPGSGSNEPPGSAGPGYDPVVLDSVAIDGPPAVDEGTQATYTATVTAKDSTDSITATAVSPQLQWSVSDPQFIIDSSTGLFQAGNVDKNATVDITATYTLAGVTKMSTIHVTVISNATRLGNLSTRLNVLTGANVLIGGFITSGTESKKMIIRAIGPSLAGFGVLDPLADPVLELHGSDGSLITTNDNWKDTQQSEIEATDLQPTNDLESAILATLEPGPYTAIVRAKDGSTGVGLVEVYDLSEPTNSKLANISTRGFVDTGDNVLIGGFIIEIDSIQVLARAIGPSLGAAKVADPLQDPTLEVKDSNGMQIAFDNDWKDTQQTEITATGLMPTDDRESAILMTLEKGAYTAIMRGQNDTTGVGLVEIYQLP